MRQLAVLVLRRGLQGNDATSVAGRLGTGFGRFVNAGVAVQGVRGLMAWYLSPPSSRSLRLFTRTTLPPLSVSTFTSREKSGRRAL